MKAVFIQRECLLEPPTADEAIQLRPEVADSLSLLVDRHFVIVVLDAGRCRVAGEAQSGRHDAQDKRMVTLIRAGGGQVHAVLSCPHRLDDECGCWGSYPGFLTAAAAEFELRLDECFLVSDQPGDVFLAHKAGCRPILVLDGRSIGELLEGHQPDLTDFPVARTFGSAVQYLLTEEESNEAWGHARQPTRISQEEEEEAAFAEQMPELSPAMKIYAPVPARRGALLAGLPPLSRRAKQALLVYVVGGVWLSLGIAYLLTHLYRVQHFPAFVWYLTLQFIPRPVRGMLFIVSGIVLVAVSLRAFTRLAPGGGKRG
jgi:histidinol phosphatase-like enzyme